jgi:hypothetical protein
MRHYAQPLAIIPVPKSKIGRIVMVYVFAFAAWFAGQQILTKNSVAVGGLPAHSSTSPTSSTWSSPELNSSLMNPGHSPAPSCASCREHRDTN